MKKDYFAVLGLKPTASEKEIRSAYKKLAKKYHPDVNPNNKRAEERFKEISEAHHVLTNPAKRRKWEAGDLSFEDLFGGGRRGGRGRGGRGFGGFDFGEGANFGGIFDLFSQMGGAAGAGAEPQATAGADLQYRATIGFEESVQGTTLHIPLAHTAPCKNCGGTGSIRSRGRRDCPQCGGAGHVAMARGPIRMNTPCPGCGGTGQVGERCQECGGAGARRVNENIRVRLRPGVENGSKVRVRGKGEAGVRGGPPGDLYVVLSVRPHRHFRKDGKNIILDLPLSLTEAALGTRLEVPTIDGAVKLTVPPASASGRRLRLKGRGVPAATGRGTRGDQIVVIQVVPPKKLDAASRKLLEDLQRRNPSNPREGLNW